MLLILVMRASSFFFFHDTATTELYTLSLHDALPISDISRGRRTGGDLTLLGKVFVGRDGAQAGERRSPHGTMRSEEHTSELQSPYDLVCRLLLEKKKKKTTHQRPLPQPSK